MSSLSANVPLIPVQFDYQYYLAFYVWQLLLIAQRLYELYQWSGVSTMPFSYSLSSVQQCSLDEHVRNCLPRSRT